MPHGGSTFFPPPALTGGAAADDGGGVMMPTRLITHPLTHSTPRQRVARLTTSTHTHIYIHLYTARRRVPPRPGAAVRALPRRSPPLPAHRLAGADSGFCVIVCISVCMYACIYVCCLFVLKRSHTNGTQNTQEGLRLSIEVFDGDFSLYSAEGPIKARMLSFGGVCVYVCMYICVCMCVGVFVDILCMYYMCVGL